MTWERGRKLSDLFDTRPIDRAARRMALEVQSRLLERVKELTPVGEPPPGVSEAEWVEARAGRLPGTLKESWERGEIEVISTSRIRVTVLTRDPIAQYVEEPTRPHVIRPTTPRIAGEGGILRFWDAQTGRLRFAIEVHHPGTEGAHMMSQALQETVALWPEWVQAELVRWEREQLRVA
jgi:hypothetical protein